MSLPLSSVLLDAPRASPEDGNRASGARSLLFRAPRRILRATHLEHIAALCAAIDQAVADGYYVAGYLAYEAGAAFWPTRLAPQGPTEPLAWFGVYDAPDELDNEAVESLLGGAGGYALSAPQFSLPHDEYVAQIERIRHHIHEGDVYQINFTAPFTFRFAGDPAGFYRALRRQQRVSYAGLLRIADDKERPLDILSLSPELFFRRDGRQLTARPMKGTIRRGDDAGEDAALALHLTADPKSRAENLMIVDLLRNDLSVVADPGSVEVPHLFTTEPYETLTQMTSTVTATLRDGETYADLFRALFPCGSVTGAPKLRAMQLIESLETEPRGVYCGAIGYIAPSTKQGGETAVFNVPIRTVVLRQSEQGIEGRMGSGSGIVWDSNPEDEYEECLLKAKFLSRAWAWAHRPRGPEQLRRIAEAGSFELLETMRAEHGKVLHRALHRFRLAEAARYFQIPLDLARYDNNLDAFLADHREGGFRLRLTVSQAGRVRVVGRPLSEASLALSSVAVCPNAVDSGDPFCWWKTTHRPHYNTALEWARNAGVDEPILVNERGEITEGARSSVWIRRGGQLLTPPLSSGGLAGVHRQHMLTTIPGAIEAMLTREDLRAADEVWVGNAVRGFVEVEYRDLG